MEAGPNHDTPGAGPLTAADVARIRADFPILEVTRNGKPLAYLDNAATTQKPQVVIETVSRYYAMLNANVHRGIHYLSQVATDQYEAAREKVRAFLGAERSSEIVFTRGTTESINLVAQTFGRQRVGPKDEILVSAMEHHSNLVPWQMLCEEKGARLRVIPMTDTGELRLDELEDLLNEKTRLVAVTHASNVLGTINPIRAIADAAHARDVPVLIDGAQSAGHLPVDVVALGCDFFACSGHKMVGPTGIGILYGRADLLESMPPWQGGGNMVRSVTLEGAVPANPPARFEAGTPNIAGTVGLGAAVDYLSGIGMDRIAAYERELLAHGVRVLDTVAGVRPLGAAPARTAILSFVMDGVHPHDISHYLDEEGIAIRAGHHCAQPVMTHFGVEAAARASLSFYNIKDELDALAPALEKVREVFG